ncbi:MAG: hypothetical protein JWQ72_453, partial [Polaromonas sp.]|nr:hypothetical protein [Polaromonas sp.]
YRAVFTEPLGGVSRDLALYNQPHLTLQESLHGFFSSLFEPLRQGELVQLCMRLHYREMLEPSGLWADHIDQEIKPAHGALVDVLCRHLGVARPDDDVHRLAFSIAGLAVQMFMCRDVVQVIRPQLMDTPGAVDAWAARLLVYAEAMVEAEARRRHDSGAAAPVPPRTTSSAAGGQHP